MHLHTTFGAYKPKCLFTRQNGTTFDFVSSIPLTGTVLAAAVPGTDDRVRARLPRCDVTFVSTYDQAVAALQENQYQGVVIAMRFDGSRMFDLLEYVRATYPETPVMCIQIEESRRLSKVVQAAAAMAVVFLGGQAFFDGMDDQVKHKDPKPFERSVDADSDNDDLKR